MVSAKGKEKVPDDGGKGKRKWSGDDKTGGRKRKNRGVLQFFEDAAYQVDEDEDSSGDSLFDDDEFLEDDFGSEPKFNNESGKVPQLPVAPKEEEMSEEEFERILGERYKPGAGFVTYAEESYELKTSNDRDIYLPSAKDPKIWKVKCMVGRERYSAFCLMQKYVDLENLGTKLQIVSAFALDHVKGFILIEAEKQHDIYEACKGLCTIYPSRAAVVPSNEISRLLSIRSRSSGISEGMWARVKNGKYKGDLALVMAVNSSRKKVTVKLIPRIDLKAMAEKFGGGVAAKRNAIPPQRLISSGELDEFRPLIHCRRDRDTNEMVEVLDGMMLKDGYLYKKISIDSLTFWGVMPTEDELLKFEPSRKDQTTDVQWLSQLFGEKKKKQVEAIKQDKGSGKSEGSSRASTGNNFELHELVFFGRKDFGVVVGSEKDETVKVIKEGPEGPSVVTVKQSELKSASFDKKLFSVLDQNSKIISVNDSVRVLNGPLKERRGIVKKIYKGVLFLYDESEQETNGYICVKAQLCEKVNLSGNASNEKGSDPGSADFLSSPKTPLSPDKSVQERENKSNFKREDNGVFSVGQPLRIRVGPLKGYLCRVLAVRRSDVTVKLDSQHKILTVKSEHLSEVRGRNSAISQGEESGSVKPFDFLGTQDGTRDWMDGTALSIEGNKWNAGGSTERSSWSGLASSSFPVPRDSCSVDCADDDTKKGTEDSGWQIGSTSIQNSSWGAAAADKKMVPDTVPRDGWGTSNGWKQDTSSTAVSSGPGSWGKSPEPHDDTSAKTDKDNSWGRAAEKWSAVGDTSGSKLAWGQWGASSEKQTDGWGNAGQDLDQPEASPLKKDCDVSNQSTAKNWQVTAAESGSGWKSSADTCDGQTENTKNWDVTLAREHATDNNPIDGWNKPKPVGADSGPSWHKQDGESSFGKPEGTSPWGKQDDGSLWGKKDQGSSWNKQDCGSSWTGESSWNKSGGISSWSQQTDVTAVDGRRGWKDQNDHSEKSKGSDGDQGVSSWKKGNRDDTYQGGNWGGSKPFDGGRGSSGRRGRGGGLGGRDQYGRRGSFDHDQSSNWNKEGQYGSNDAGNGSGWNRDQAGGWGKAVSTDASKKNDGSEESNVSGEHDKPAGNQGWQTNKDGGQRGDEWVTEKPDEINTSGGWNTSQSFSNSELSGWGRTSTENEDIGAAGKGHNSWSKEKMPNDKNSSWNAQTTTVDGNQPSQSNIKGSWGSQKASEVNISNWNQDGKDGQSGAWNNEKKVDGGLSTCWGQSNWSKSGKIDSGHDQRSYKWGAGWSGASRANEEAGLAGKSQGSWDQEMKPNDNKKSSWNTGTSSVDGDHSSDWNTKGSWGSQNASEVNISGWNQKGKDGQSGTWGDEKKADGGSSSGWGQSNWSKIGTSDTGGDQDSKWSSKSNWNSGSGFQASNNQDEASAGGGRGGSWRGGQGERGDRGGFRGRGRSDRGGFGGRGGSSWGGSGGGSGRGGFGGRGGSDREGVFRGRGGFRGRGRGDWNNRAGDSNQEKPNSWYKGSNNDAEWKSSGNGGSWNRTESDNNQSQNQSSSWNQPFQGGSWNQVRRDNNQRQSWSSSWNQREVNPSSGENTQSGEWSKDGGQSGDTGAGGWGSSNASSEREVSGGWNNPPANKETGGWNIKSDWNGSDSTEKGQLNESNKSEGPENCGKAAGSSWEAASGSGSSSGNWKKPEATDDGQAKGVSKDEGPSDSWGKATLASWGSGSRKGGW